MTENFIVLTNHISAIKKGLKLNKKIPYEEIDNHQELIKGYILLVHAQLEYYFEQVSYKIASNSYNNYKTNQIINKPLLSMASVSLFDVDYPGAFEDSRRKKEINVDDRLSQIFSKYYQIIKENHGISEKYLINMFWPLGFESTFFDSALITLLSSFSAKRGKIAHTLYNDEILSFETIEEEVNNIMEVLKKFDEKIKKIEI